MNTIRKIISGGQTGVDRAALDAALDLAVSSGGWCPKGRLAEDGIIPNRYALQESVSRNYEERTEWNVRDSDGTLVLTVGLPTGGTAFTVGIARKWQRPFYIYDFDSKADASGIHLWLNEQKVKILNVAGPRESKCPGIYMRAIIFMKDIMGG